MGIEHDLGFCGIINGGDYIFCSNCGKQLSGTETFCSACGQRVAAAAPTVPVAPVASAVPTAGNALLNTLSQRMNTNGIIWIVIAVLQIIGGIVFDWFMLVVGVLNIISAVQDINYSKAVLANPTGIVAKFEPIVGPIITLVYNLVIGGIIGVAGSIYYFVAIRNFVMENKVAFAALDGAVAPAERVQ